MRVSDGTVSQGPESMENIFTLPRFLPKTESLPSRSSFFSFSFSFPLPSGFSTWILLLELELLSNEGKPRLKTEAFFDAGERAVEAGREFSGGETESAVETVEIDAVERC